MADTIELTRDLRDLLRIQRKEVAALTQKGAALAAGDMSEVWWRQIESGQVDAALADTVARMAYAIDISPDQLRNIGQHHVADLVERRRALLQPETRTLSGAAMEEHLMATPGLSEAQRILLIELARGLLRAEQDASITIAT